MDYTDFVYFDMKRELLILISFMTIYSVLYARQDELPLDTTPFYRMSIEQLMNVNINVATQSPMNNRESPAIITIISGDEIKRSGAKDLLQLLQQVPGFDFGLDVDGVVGIGVRGNWGHEGKVLLLWDGMEMNEDLYSTLQFGEHYPLENIKQIEIIRGPGSAMYGGNAEYAVINVKTTLNSDFNGISATVNNSWIKDTYGTRGYSIAAGKSIGQAHINFSSSLHRAIRSTEMYSDYKGESYDMTNQSGLGETNYRVDLFVKGLSVTGLYDKYFIQQRDGYDAIYIRPYKTEFNTGNITAKYEWKNKHGLSLTPGIRLKFQQPWSYRDDITDDDFLPFNTTVNKREYYVNANLDVNERVNIIGGAVYYNQVAREHLDSVYFNNGTKTFVLDNYASYLQSIIKFKEINLILGSRFDYNTSYGFSFVPRIGITRVRDSYHLKALYSSAFRAPSIENINTTRDIKPERTNVAEIEAGLKLGDHSYITANIFDITTRDPIVFYYDANMADQYKNEDMTGSRGIEVEYKWKSRRWYAAVNYSYFTTDGHPVISIYNTPGHDGHPLGFPSHKASFNSNFNISDKINFSPSVMYLAKRYSYLQSADSSVSSLAYKPNFSLNASINFDNIFCEGFHVQASYLNILDNELLFIQPYNGNHMPLPGTGCELQLKLTYNFLFTKI